MKMNELLHSCLILFGDGYYCISGWVSVRLSRVSIFLVDPQTLIFFFIADTHPDWAFAFCNLQDFVPSLAIVSRPLFQHSKLCEENSLLTAEGMFQ